MRFRLVDLSGGMLKGFPDLVGHVGSTGAFAYYLPEWDAVITGTFDQTGYEREHIMALINILTVLMRIEG
jgi:hypothetical protein